VLYFDTSALMAIYTIRDGSPEIMDFLNSKKSPITTWSFTEVEFESALKQLVRMKVLTEAKRLDAQAFYLSDTKLGRVNSRVVLDVRDIHDIAKSIIAKPKYNERSMDAIHVASSIYFKCKTFVSLDLKQRNMARRERLSVFPESIKGE
jgi:predicted nucleic acid-binding protein